MSDGHFCFVRDLGLVKGGKGMKHHEVIVDFNRRGMVELFKRAFARPQRGALSGERDDRVAEAPASVRVDGFRARTWRIRPEIDDQAANSDSGSGHRISQGDDRGQREQARGRDRAEAHDPAHPRRYRAG
jgi:hypothetical protein